ncbi:DUF1871 family protein [Caloramator sp. CAR-1]|uniref:DUF1871 family protein n=1 Tax=Caloramator sp. CAR-1 TaxID=3062777 RepID=UPI0026E20AE5|nr:DUF1871 family protein [Caloramator sp. CAR-1]MDO6355716.1 DUF1871 family protein [Caloramator sp. CAR-1]
MKDKVAKIINEWDPIDLFPFSPKDEYEVEIELISKLVDKRIDLESLANNIYDLFIKRFGDDVFTRSYDECFIIAKKIFTEK